MDDPYFLLLQEMIAKAYAPYSRFPVAAVACGVSGTHYSGVNVENAAYPQEVGVQRQARFLQWFQQEKPNLRK